jgi:hypothetical protein
MIKWFIKQPNILPKQRFLTIFDCQFPPLYIDVSDFQEINPNGRVILFVFHSIDGIFFQIFKLNNVLP